MKFNLNHEQLKDAERSVYSQSGQDGVLQEIFYQTGTNKRFIEFGARDGIDISNTAHLRLNCGWDGLLMDATPKSRYVKKEFITAENINYLVRKYRAGDATYLSIDLDGNDYWIWKEISCRPSVVTIEYNSKFGPNESYVIPYDKNHFWAGDDYYGASLLALKKLGEQKGYTLVHAVSNLDAVFVRNDFVDESYRPPTVEELLPEPIECHKPSNKQWVKI